MADRSTAIIAFGAPVLFLLAILAFLGGIGFLTVLLVLVGLLAMSLAVAIFITTPPHRDS